MLGIGQMCLVPILFAGLDVSGKILAREGIDPLLLFGSIACNFLASRLLQLSETVPIQFAAPPTVALLAGLLLSEWSSWQQLMVIAFGDVPSGWALLGTAIVVGLGLVLLAQDAARRKR